MDEHARNQERLHGLIIAFSFIGGVIAYFKGYFPQDAIMLAIWIVAMGLACKPEIKYKYAVAWTMAFVPILMNRHLPRTVALTLVEFVVMMLGGSWGMYLQYRVNRPWLQEQRGRRRAASS